MKKFFFIIFALMLGFGACKNIKSTTEGKNEPSFKDKLVGEWKLYAVNGIVSEDNSNTKILYLKSNGTGSIEEEKFHWKVVEKDNKLFFESKNNKKDPELMEILVLENKKTILKDKKKELHFIR